ncbi:MAG: CPBP family intramembrane glutamic endopeptidase [Chloroflexota bacterium]
MNSHQRGKLSWGLWLTWLLLSSALIVGLMAVDGESDTMTPIGWAAVVLGLAPLMAAQFVLGFPKEAARVRARLNAVRWPLLSTAGGVTGLFILSGLVAGRFDPYAATIFGFGAFAALGTLRQIEKGKSGLTWADAAVWLLLWIPFDLRWNQDLWFGKDGFVYNWWAVAITVVAIIGWYAFRELPDFGYRLIPKMRDLGIGLLATAALLVIVVPIGMAVDFITFPPTEPIEPLTVLVYFIGLFLTVAIPEELFFRGILLHGLDQMFKRRWVGLLLSSLAFGLMHWNNTGDLSARIAYCSLASVAGVFYGWAYRKSGNNILAPVITHTLIDLIWRVLFR